MWIRGWLTHWIRVTHICVSKIIIIGSDNGLSPGWRQAIIWPNAGILLIGYTFKWNIIWNQYIFIQELDLKIVVYKMASISAGPRCNKYEKISRSQVRICSNCVLSLAYLTTNNNSIRHMSICVIDKATQRQCHEQRQIRYQHAFAFINIEVIANLA